MAEIIKPPFTEEAALRKVQIAEDLWNTRDAERVAMAYTEDSEWRNRTEFLSGRKAIVEFLRRKWNRELDYRLKKELWGFRNNLPRDVFRENEVYRAALGGSVIGNHRLAGELAGLGGVFRHFLDRRRPLRL